jgi:type II secretion system protein D
MPRHRFILRASTFILSALLFSTALNAQVPPPPPPPTPSNPSPTPPALQNPGVDSVTIQLPNNPVTEVLSIYESLTGKRLLRDANLAGPNISIFVPGQLPKKDAIALIESALLLNGYSIVPLDDRTSKVLGQGRSPLGEAIPLFADPSLLPRTEELASYFMLLNYISPQDALQVFSNYVTMRPQGTIVAVPNSNALVITDNTTLIRRLIDLQRFIDVPGARILTEFIPLTRADAERVAETVNKLLEEENNNPTASANGLQPPSQNAIPSPGVPGDGASPAPSIPSVTGDPSTIQRLNSLIRVIPDSRTNRILVVAPEHRMGYLQRLIRDLDAAVSLDTALERPLQFVSAADVLPVLQSILAEGDETSSTATTSGGTSSSNAGTGSNLPLGGGGGRSGDNSITPNLLGSPQEATAPQAVSVGKARIIADRSSNKIIVLGPPEVREKAARVLDMLDQRPKQIYLAVIIGQLTLRNQLEVGFDYLIKYKESTGNNGNTLFGLGGLTRTGALDILPDPSTLLNNDLLTRAGAAGGLTVFGTIAETVDIYAKFLAQNGDFKVISRPIVYTANNKKAVIASGQDVPVPTSTVTSALATDPNQTSTALTSNIGFKKVELKLEVIPLVNSEDEVTLTIAQQNNNIIDTVLISQNRVPVIGTQELTTTVTVRNRNTIVLGGLITEEDRRDTAGIPLLKDIPGLGYLFSNTAKEVVRRELIILIQPFIISDHQDLLEAQMSMREASRLDDEIQDLEAQTIRRAEPIYTFPAQPQR